MSARIRAGSEDAGQGSIELSGYDRVRQGRAAPTGTGAAAGLEEGEREPAGAPRSRLACAVSSSSPTNRPSRERREITNEQFLLAWIIGAVGGVVVFLHADRNGSRHPTAWAIWVFLLPITALIYVIHVRRSRRAGRL
jgi:hypothetical protein